MQIRTLYLLLTFILTGSGLFAQVVFINEINYTASNPQARGVEVVNPQQADLAGWNLWFYDASGHHFQVSPVLPAPELGPSGGGASGIIIWVDVMAFDTEDKGGVVLTDHNSVPVQFLSFGGSLVAYDGPAAGNTADYVGDQASGGASLQLMGVGLTYSDFQWTNLNSSTPGSININQTFTNEHTWGSSSLPVEWVTYYGTALERGIALTWITAAEENSKVFRVESSVDGQNFRTVAEVPSKGPSTSNLRYDYLHAHPQEGINYYRISQIDQSGRVNTNKILAVRYQTLKTIELYPVPATTELHVGLPLRANDYEVQLLNMHGQIVRQRRGSGWLYLRVGDLPRGVYTLSIRQGAQRELRQVLLTD